MASVIQSGERTTGLGNIVTFVNGTILPAPQAVVLNAGRTGSHRVRPGAR